jgi:hypothetical protein
MSDEPRVEIRLPEVTEDTPLEHIVAVHALADALGGEQVDWPADATEGWDLLLGWAERVPGSWVGFTASATSLRLANGGTITRLTTTKGEPR